MLAENSRRTCRHCGSRLLWKMEPCMWLELALLYDVFPICFGWNIHIMLREKCGGHTYPEAALLVPGTVAQAKWNMFIALQPLAPSTGQVNVFMTSHRSLAQSENVHFPLYAETITHGFSAGARHRSWCWTGISVVWLLPTHTALEGEQVRAGQMLNSTSQHIWYMFLPNFRTFPNKERHFSSGHTLCYLYLRTTRGTSVLVYIHCPIHSHPPTAYV